MSARDNFIKRSVEQYGNKYDYSKVVWNGCKTDVTIHCNLHNIDFQQKPSLHYHWEGCPECSKIKKGKLRRSNNEEFIEKALKIHGKMYDYSLVEYDTNSTPITIVCKEHGEFKIKPSEHLQGKGCPICRKIQNETEYREKQKNEFIEKSRKIHKNFYDYSEMEYIDRLTKISIICPIHGVFKQSPKKHLNGQGCPHCFDERRNQDKNVDFKTFVERTRQIHENKYNYGKTKENYVNLQSVVTIVCPIHGEYKQKACTHLIGCGCPKCANETRNINNKIGVESFIERSKEIHGDFYDYSLVRYVNRMTPVTIICPIHGEFQQSPNKHLIGHGCPKCCKSRMEREISLFLEENNIKYEEEKRFEWLGRQRLDFYLPEFNIALECQGIQHIKPVERFGGQDSFEKSLILDDQKKRLCSENKVKLLYYTNVDCVFPYHVFKDKEKLLEEIMKLK